jgi:hypothetical protein
MNPTMEIYKPIMGFEDDYAVSNYGNVLSTKSTRRRRQLKLALTVWGYPFACLCKNNKRHSLVVHRIVWQAFHGKIENGLQINHIDGNKKNNRLENLELVTAQENSIHAVKTGLRKTVNTGKKVLSKEDIAAIKFFYVRRYGQVKSLAKIFDRNRQTILKIAMS